MKKAPTRALALLVAALLCGVGASGQQTERPQPTSPIETDVLVIAGRFVAAETGEPLARCRVRLTAHQSTGYDLAWRCGDWADPPEQTTRDDGRFRFALRLPNRFEEVDRARFHLNVSHPGRVAWFSHCTFHVARRRGRVDYGDVALPEGVRPLVRVVDGDGALQAGVLLQLRPTTPAGEHAIWRQPGGPVSWLSRRAYARTDVDGYLHLRDPLPAGSFRVTVENREPDQVPEVVTLPAPDPIELRVAPLPASAITGRLIDDDGAPLGGVTLRAGSRGESTSTLRDGRFVLLPNDARPIVVEAARNRRYDSWTQLGAVEAGARDITLELPSTKLTTLVVTDPDGRPVEAFNAYCMPVGDRERSPVRLDGSYRGGRAPCRLAAGEWQVRVFPRTGRLLPSAWQPVTIDESGQQVTVQVEATEARPVRLRFPDGAPVANARVEVLSAAPADRFVFAPPATADTEPGSGPPRAGRLELLAAARSDAAGLATLRLASGGRAVVRVSGDDVATSVHEVAWADARDAPVAIEVGRGVLLRGRLSPHDAAFRLDPSHDASRSSSIYSYFSRERPTLIVVHEDGTRRSGVRIADDGTFRFAGFGPGKVAVLLQLMEDVGDNRFRRVVDPPEIGSCELVVGEPRALQLQVPKQLLDGPAAGAGDGR